MNKHDSLLIKCFSFVFSRLCSKEFNWWFIIVRQSTSSWNMCDMIHLITILFSRQLLSKYATILSNRVNKLRSLDTKDIATRTVKQLLKFCLDPSIPIPTFCARNLARLPPVGVEHVKLQYYMKWFCFVMKFVQWRNCGQSWLYYA